MNITRYRMSLGIKQTDICKRAGIVDGVKIKADTWYKCKNGKLVEA